MLQATLIGNVGGEPRTQETNGNKFTTFRVAHNDRWTDKAGQQHNSTIWVDCIMNDRPKVVEFLKPGTQVAIMGSVTLRVYSSEKDRCMKPGMTINVRTIELLGGASDDVPTRLFDANGVMHDTKKYYATDVRSCNLRSANNRVFNVDANGWVFPVQEQPATVEQPQNNEPKPF